MSGARLLWDAVRSTRDLRFSYRANAAIVQAAAGIIAAVGTAGAGLPAAKATFVTAFKICLTAKVGSSALGISLPQSCGWGDWR